MIVCDSEAEQTSPLRIENPYLGGIFSGCTTGEIVKRFKQSAWAGLGHWPDQATVLNVRRGDFRSLSARKGEPCEQLGERVAFPQLTYRASDSKWMLGFCSFVIRLLSTFEKSTTS